MKRSCFILGCGRSGTSLAAGLLARTGYFMGDQLFPPDDGNPKGYFEDHEINGINEGLLAQLLPGSRRTMADKLLGRPRPRSSWYRWLAELPVEATIPCPPRFADRIRPQVSRQPFCFKDPRFCYTLGIWRAFAPAAAILCVFRDPEVAAASIVKEAARHDLQLDGAPVDHARASSIWRAMYAYALQVHRPAGGDWLFVHYEQLLDGTAYPALEQLLDVKIDREFADPALRRSAALGAPRPEVVELYRQLRGLAGFSPA